MPKAAANPKPETRNLKRPASGGPGGGKTPAELVRQANRWRDSYNPLRSLVVSRVVAMMEQAERGDYVELQLTLRKIEKRYPVLKALKARRLSALEKLDWSIKTMDPLPEGVTAAQAEEQKNYLRSRYELVENLTDSFGQLALAEFRGFTILQKHRFEDGPNDGAVCELHWLPQYTWSKTGEFGDWYYNQDSRIGVSGAGCAGSLGEANRLGTKDNPSDTLPRSEFVVREVDSPLYEIALIAFVNWSMGRKDYAAFVEIFGLPNAVAIMPPNIPTGKEEEYRAAAEKVADGASGAMPNGGDVKFPTASVRGNAPFKEYCDVHDQDVVLAGTGGLLTMLSMPQGIGSGSSQQHADAFEDIAIADARKINGTLQRDFDCPELDAQFPGQPHAVYFELAAQDEEDVTALCTNVSVLTTAGFKVNQEWLEEKTGIELDDPAPVEPSLVVPPSGGPVSTPDESDIVDSLMRNRRRDGKILNYDPDQDRDEDGKWSGGGGGHTVHVKSGEDIPSAEARSKARDATDTHDRTVPSLVTVRDPSGKATSLSVEHDGKDWVVKSQHGQTIPGKKFHSRDDAKEWTQHAVTKELARRYEKSIKDGTYKHSGNISPVQESRDAYERRNKITNRDTTSDLSSQTAAFAAAVQAKIDPVAQLINRIANIKDDASMVSAFNNFLTHADAVTALVTTDVSRAAHALEQLTAPALARGLQGKQP